MLVREAFKIKKRLNLGIVPKLPETHPPQPIWESLTVIFLLVIWAYQTMKWILRSTYFFPSQKYHDTQKNLQLSVFMNSSHLGVIHVRKRIRTFSIWRGRVQTMEFKTEVGIDTRAKNGGVWLLTPKSGGPTCGRRPRDSAPPASDCFWHLPIPGYFVYVCMVQQSTTCKFTHYQHSAYKQSVDTLFLTPLELLFIIGQLHIAQQSCTVKFCSSTSLSASNLQQQQCTMRLQADIEIFL